jgi:arylsulfatase A-like enzyme
MRNAVITVLLIGTLFMWGCENEQNSSKPNIIVFFVDDMGYNDVGFRNTTFYTPNIDKLQKEGLTFENAYVPSSTCSPSRVGLLTGQHPARLGFYRHCFGTGEYNVQEGDTSLLLSRNWLPLDVVTYGDVLKKTGYNTFFAGKWHIGGEEYGPDKHGFDIVVSNPHAGHVANFYPPYFHDGKTVVKNIPKDKYLTDLLTDTVVNYISNYQSKEPFLLQFSYYNVHSPNIGKKKYVKMYEKNGLKGQFARYCGQVSAMDESVGRVLDALKKSGKDKNTIVIFTSDQGSAFPNTPLRGGKKRGTALYEGGIKVPFIIKWPGVTKPGTSDLTHIQTTDLFPTFVQIVGEAPENYNGIEGVSLVAHLKNNTPVKERYLIGFRTYDAQYASVLAPDDWKLIAYLDGKHQLYKVDEDISEQNNLADKYPDKVQELLKILQNWEKKAGVDIKIKQEL